MGPDLSLASVALCHTRAAPHFPSQKNVIAGETEWVISGLASPGPADSGEL